METSRYENLKGGRVLCIDDSKVILTFISLTLAELGFEVKTFTNPEEALSELEEFAPDCVLTDYEMPEMSGVEVIKKLRANEKTASIPAVVLTSKEDDKLILECINAGATDYLLKKSSAEVIVAKVLLLVESKRFRDNMRAAERLKTYTATVNTLDHELNNLNQSIQMLLMIMKSDQADKLSREQIVTRLESSVTKITGLLKAFRGVEEVAFEGTLIDLNKEDG